MDSHSLKRCLARLLPAYRPPAARLPPACRTGRAWQAMTVIFLLISSGSVFAAQNYDLKEITPAVQNALDGRKSRYAELERLKSEGTIGENNQGSVKLLKDSAGVRGFIDDENRDREAIYQAIVDQNHLGTSGMTEVRAVFAEVQRGKAKSGEFFQSRSGEWAQK